jgi:hypothetical protein
LKTVVIYHRMNTENLTLKRQANDKPAAESLFSHQEQGNPADWQSVGANDSDKRTRRIISAIHVQAGTWSLAVGDFVFLVLAIEGYFCGAKKLGSVYLTHRRKGER